MDNASYVSLARQSGLLRELNSIANNIANVNTTGYRRESTLFAEHVKALGSDPSVSIATTAGNYVDFSEGEIATSNNPLDFAIDGDGFFLVETPSGPALTRAGAFALNGVGEIVDANGRRVLDQGGSPIVVPPQTKSISATPDGTISADGQAVGKLGIVKADPDFLVREGDNLFRTDKGYQPVDNPKVRQFALEGSNVSAVAEIAKLIEVQRTYEMGQKFLSDDDDRIKQTVRELGQGQ
ncbi:MAG TPA: flagellar hook-basal body complex protein [Parvularculaceae bacterium]|nr:flagellar hook-basal body complex protein [Parvularculaceae bacterium]